jgi:ribosomal protein S18 acetylase RimI-like enzyme
MVATTLVACIAMTVPATLRAAIADDEPLLREVYASTRAVELAMVPWSEEQKAQFCDMQFTAQDTDYRRNYPAAQFQIIVQAGTSIGRLYVDRRESEIHVLDITLLPAHRGKGIGSGLLRDLQDEARAAGKSLGIHVEKFNPALRLYERLGFRAKEDQGVYLLMEWRAA